jgi:CheY-like chemotaxis protein
VRILLADDSVTAQNMGKKILGEAGHEVLAVSNGAAALKKINEERPDLIILDIYMPGYTGLEVCQRVKESREISRTPVLLTVGKLEPFKKEDARRVRAEGVVVKPFEASELMAAVNKIAEYVVATPAESKSKLSLKQKAARAQAAAPAEEMEAPQPPPMDLDAALADSERKEAAKVAADPTEDPPVVQEQEEAKPAEERDAPKEAHASPDPIGDRSEAGAHSSDHDELATSRHAAEIARAGAADEDRVSDYLAHAVAATAEDAPFVPPAARAVAAATSSSIAEESRFPASTPEVAAPVAEFSIVNAAVAPSASPVPMVPMAVAHTASVLEVARQDPAFIADRNEELSSFPTHFGVKEAVHEPAHDQIVSHEDEVTAALASLPGDESDGTGANGVGQAWIEEVPIEAGENAVLLEDEMSQAEAAESTTSLGPLETVDPALTVAGQARDFDAFSPPDRKHDPASTPAHPAEFTVTAPARKQDSPPAAPNLQPAAAPGWDEPKRTAADATQSHSDLALADPVGRPAEVDVAAVENIVGRLLDELKPKLVTQILRELANGKK